MAKEILYSSIDGFKGFNDVVYVEPEVIKKAREVLDKGDSEIIGIDRNYHLEGCTVIDFKSLGLRIRCDDELKFDSLVKKLFPKDEKL